MLVSSAGDAVVSGRNATLAVPGERVKCALSSVSCASGWLGAVAPCLHPSSVEGARGASRGAVPVPVSVLASVSVCVSAHLLYLAHSALGLSSSLFVVVSRPFELLLTKRCPGALLHLPPSLSRICIGEVNHFTGSLH